MSYAGLANLAPAQPTDQAQHGDTVARCPYCTTYGPLGRCQACGAPNEPADAHTHRPTHTRPTFPRNLIIR